MISDSVEDVITTDARACRYRPRHARLPPVDRKQTLVNFRYCGSFLRRKVTDCKTPASACGYMIGCASPLLQLNRRAIEAVEISSTSGCMQWNFSILRGYHMIDRFNSLFHRTSMTSPNLLASNAKNYCDTRSRHVLVALPTFASPCGASIISVSIALNRVIVAHYAIVVAPSSMSARHPAAT